jgi:hypothetical protein
MTISTSELSRASTSKRWIVTPLVLIVNVRILINHSMSCSRVVNGRRLQCWGQFNWGYPNVNTTK